MRVTIELALATILVLTALPGAAVARPPLYLEVWPRVHGGPGHVGVAHGPFVSDIALHPGDEIELEVRTSSVAHVYLLHCDGDATLSIFPDAGGIAFHADQWVALPAVGMRLRVGAKPGPEVLYIVATRDPLELADVALSKRLSQDATRADAASCDAALENALRGPASENARREPLPQPRSLGALMPKTRYALRGIDVSSDTIPIARAFTDSDGVAVLRLRYRNEP